MRPHTIFKNRELSTKREFRVAFIVNRDFKPNVTTSKLISIYGLSIYTSKSIQVHNQFYDRLEGLYDPLSPNNTKILLGDFNAIIGSK